MKTPNIDWVQAKKDFLLDEYMTLKEVAEKHDIGYSKMKKLSTRRKWYAEKKEIWKLIKKSIDEEIYFTVDKNIREQLHEVSKESLKKEEERLNQLAFKTLSKILKP